MANTGYNSLEEFSYLVIGIQYPVTPLVITEELHASTTTMYHEELLQNYAGLLVRDSDPSKFAPTNQVSSVLTLPAMVQQPAQHYRLACSTTI